MIARMGEYLGQQETAHFFLSYVSFLYKLKNTNFRDLLLVCFE